MTRLLGPYYGTVDATALFVMLLHRLYGQTDDLTLVRELRPHWEAALTWMTEIADADGDGFLEFSGAGEKGLAVQTWKDSWDSLSHRDGRLAEGAIAGSEVQGYAYAAYRAAADFYDALGDREAAQGWRERAEGLKRSFHDRFWLDELQTYALALDGDKCPLEVQKLKRRSAVMDRHRPGRRCTQTRQNTSFLKLIGQVGACVRSAVGRCATTRCRITTARCGHTIRR